MPRGRRQGRLYFLPVRLGRGKGMVPVAHGDGQRRPAGRVRVFCVERRLCAQRRYGVFHSRNVRSVRYRPACNVPAAQHQLRVVQFFQRRLFFRERLHHAAGSVIQQHHDMRRFQRRAPAHGKARRNTLHNGIFAGTHQRCGAFFIAVSLQVHSAHKALPHTALRRAFHIYKTVDTACEHPGAVIGHGGVDGRNATVHIRAFQICLRQGNVQCAGRVLSERLGLLPVFGLACELVARQRGPQAHIRLRCGQQNIRCDKWFHFRPLRISDNPCFIPLNGPPRAAPVIFL